MIKIIFRFSIQKSIDWFKKHKQYNQGVYQNLIKELSTDLEVKRIAILGERIHKHVLYYLAEQEKQTINKLLCTYYEQNMKNLNQQQLAQLAAYNPNKLKEIISQFQSQQKISQFDFCSLLCICMQENEWEGIPELIERIILGEQIEQKFLNQILIIPIQYNIKAILQSCKLVCSERTEINEEQYNQIKKLMGDGLMSRNSWLLYQEQILKINQKKQQDNFIRKHILKYYQIEQQTEITLEQLLENDQSIEFKEISDIKYKSLYELIPYNRYMQQYFEVTKKNQDLQREYFDHVLDELKQFLEHNQHSIKKVIKVVVAFLNSISGVKIKKQMKKEIDPIDGIYRLISEKIFNHLVENHMEISIDETVDPFAQELMKITKKKVGKWKEESDALKIKLKLIEEDSSKEILQLSQLYCNNQQGTCTFHYVLIKHLLKYSKVSPDIVYHITKLDKLFLIDGNKIHLEQYMNYGLDYIQLLYYKILNISMDNIRNDPFKNVDIQKVLKTLEMKAQYQLIQRILQIEYPSIRFVESNYLHEFQEYWLNLQDENDELCQDVRKFLDNNQYFYEYKKEMDIWKFLFVQENTIIFCISRKLYMGASNQLLVEIPILKRVLRHLDYKLRILDHREYFKFETRHEKNTYIEERLKNLNKVPMKEKGLYYNF